MLSGNNFIGYDFSGESAEVFNREITVNNQLIQIGFHEATPAEIGAAVAKAAQAFNKYRQLSATKRADFLKSIAAMFTKAKDELIELAQAETHLSETRLKGEMQRTINQINSFVQLLQEGSWVRAIIDTAQPERVPLPKPDVRQMQQPLGPVGVFGASNFPFAFSVAGGDTISALAAGCTVVYKAHPGHPATSERAGLLIREAAKKCGLPDGTFSLIQGTSHASGQALVVHPLLKAVAFTGSFAGGKALYDAAATRSEPIPVFAEMGSINPVFILPRMLQEKGAAIADALAPSNLLSAGQFCTNPGVVTYMQSHDAAAFTAQFALHIKNASGENMLTPSIHSSYSKNLEKLAAIENLRLVSSGRPGNGQHAATPHLYQTTAAVFLQQALLMEEVFGPGSIQVAAQTKEELLEVASRLTGQLTTSIWATEGDLAEFSELVRILELKAGRIIYNAVPTGVEVTHAMVHGGPYPATTDSKTTSVGTGAIYRFTRPVCYQGLPQTALPDALKNENPLQLWRQVNGEPTKNSL